MDNSKNFSCCANEAGHIHEHSSCCADSHDSHDHHHHSGNESEYSSCCSCNHSHEHSYQPDHAAEAEILAGASQSRTIYRIINMDCPMEEALIRKRLASVPGITGLQFNLMQRLLTVDHVPGNTGEIESALRSIDMNPEIPTINDTHGELENTSIPWRKLVWSIVLAAFSEIFELMAEWQVKVFGINFPELQIANVPVLEIFAFMLALCAILLSGIGTFRKGWLAISNFNLNINALMSIAVTGAVLIGQFPEAAMVMVLFNISEAIEARALDRARNAIKSLLDLAPKTASVKDGSGQWREKNLEDIEIGDIVRVRPGEKVALDGIVVVGESAINQAPITGESMPVEKKAGDVVYGGTINETGSLEYKVSAKANDTTLARIIHAVEEAQGSRAPMQRFVDVFAKYYTPAVLLLALIWAIVPPLFFSASWYESIYTALVILVIGCPCALVISTPVTVVSGMAAATRKGILVKGGLYLELGRRMNSLALDKTGTITWGKPRQTDFINFDIFPAEKSRAIAESLASSSDHPVSCAIAAANREFAENLPVEDFRALPGMGVSGKIDGKLWHMGNLRLVENLGMENPEIIKNITELENQGKSVVALIGPDKVIALFAVADTVKESSIEAMKQLKALNVNAIMLTGDNEPTARAIAREVGVSEFYAGLLPQQKLEIIEKLEKDGIITGMVGDGINDSPALAKANIGFAMAKEGTDIAIETADVALMDDDLRKIPRFINLSRSTWAILVENIALALGIKLVFFVLTLTGNSTMWMAVFADVGAALLVVANGLRILRK